MSRRHDWIAVATLALLTLILFSDVLAGSHALATGDLAPFHYPEKKVLREIVRGGEFPYWNRALSAGQPLAANPQHEVFYPPNWLILLPGFTFAFHLLIVLHVLLAMIAMYALLRSMELAIPAAIFGALSFALGGALLSTLGLLPFLFSIAWMPLTIRFARERRVAWGALSLAMQLLVGEPVIVMQTVLLLALHARRKSSIWIVIAAPFLAAVQILPALDHFADSVRSRGFDFRIVSHYSFSPARLVELLAPQHLPGGFLLSIYCGVAVAVLALAGVVARVRGWGAFVIAFAVALIIALGNHTPLLRVAYDLGLVRWLRYPEKFMLMAIVAAIVFAAATLDALLAGNILARRAAMVLSVLATPVALVRALVLLVLLASATHVKRAVWLAIAAICLLADLAMQIPELAPRVPQRYYTDEPAIARTLPQPRASYRILHEADWDDASAEARSYLRPSPQLPWVLRNGMFAMVPAAYGFQTVVDIDYDLTALRPTDDFGRAAFALSRVRPREWGEIIAPMANVWMRAVYRPPERVEINESIEPVMFVPAVRRNRYAFATRLVTIHDRDEFVRELAARPDPGTAFIAEPAFTPAPGRVLSARESANTATIDVEADGRAFLVMSVTPHKYWTTTIDGAEERTIVTNAGFQGVVVPRGHHVIAMRYRNPLIAAGAAISLAALLGLAFATMRAL